MHFRMKEMNHCYIIVTAPAPEPVSSAWLENKWAARNTRLALHGSARLTFIDSLFINLLASYPQHLMALHWGKREKKNCKSYNVAANTGSV